MTQPNPTPTEKPLQTTVRKNGAVKYVVTILILLTVCIYLFVSKNKIAADNATTLKTEQKQVDSLNATRMALQTDFDAASAKIDQLVTLNGKKDADLQGQKTEIAKLQGQIKHILANAKATALELKNAREMITSLNGKTAQYEARIAELEKENTILTGNNQVLAREVDSTGTENVRIKTVASVLHASNLRIEPLHKKRSGKEKETTRARKVDVLRIKFDIDENRIAESGSKEVYVRIIGPDGNVLTTNTSGTLPAKDGTAVNYSIKKDIMLTQNQVVKDVSVDWNQDRNYPKGNYTVEIYNGGYKVGSGNVALVKSFL